MMRVIEQTWKEMVGMYMKCDKKKLAEMLATRDAIEQNQNHTDPFVQTNDQNITFPYEGGFTDHNGHSVTTGDTVLYHIDGRVGVLKEALQDGDAYVKFPDDSDGNVKWTSLEKLNVSST